MTQKNHETSRQKISVCYNSFDVKDYYLGIMKSQAKTQNLCTPKATLNSALQHVPCFNNPT